MSDGDEAPLLSGEIIDTLPGSLNSPRGGRQGDQYRISSPWQIRYEHAFTETRQDFTATAVIQLVLFAASLVIAIENFRLLTIVACGVGVVGSIIGLSAVKFHRHLPPRRIGAFLVWIFMLIQVAGVGVSIGAAVITYRGLARYTKDCPQDEDDSTRSITSFNCPPKIVLGIAAAISPVLLAAFLCGAIYSRRLQNLAAMFVKRNNRVYGANNFAQSPS
jgi:hypothetical protein